MTMGNEVVRYGAPLAERRQAVQDALHSKDPWKRSEAAADEWLKELRSDGTRDQYARVFTSWWGWCDATRVSPLDAKRTDVTDYKRVLEEKGNPSARPDRRRPLAPRSVARHIAALSSFYNWAVDAEVTGRNPVPRAARIAVSRESRQPYLKPEHLRALIAEADKNPRDGALVALLALVCLRVSEALAAGIEDLAPEGDGTASLWVVRKGRKGEHVLVVPAAYARVQRAVGKRKSGLIIATSTGRALDRKAAWSRVSMLGRRAGIATPIGPHTLRHAYITRGHELKIPVADLQIAAGHESVETTRRYDRRKLDPKDHPSTEIAADLAPPLA